MASRNPKQGRIGRGAPAEMSGHHGCLFRGSRISKPRPTSSGTTLNSRR